MHNPLDLARIHTDSLYELDANGRMARVREPQSEPPPRFALIRTREGHIALARHDLPATLARLLLGLAEREPVLVDPLEPPTQLDGYIDALSKHATIERIDAGPAFVLPGGQTILRGVTRISSGNAAVLGRYFPWTRRHLQVHSPVWAVVEGAVAVAICFSAREPSLGMEAGVFTVEGYRGRGYAQRLVAAWAGEISKQALIPLYSTSWENTPSRRIAERLGARLYAVDFSLI